MYDKQFFRILRQRYEDINSLLLITSRKKTIIVAIYVKTQQAYFAESLKAGGWTLIGYSTPNNGTTTNFTYGIDLGISAQNSDALESSKIGWNAKNNVALNECASAVNWTVTLSKATGTTSADISFAASAGTAGCVALTPTFDKIGK